MHWRKEKKTLCAQHYCNSTEWCRALLMAIIHFSSSSCQDLWWKVSDKLPIGWIAAADSDKFSICHFDKLTILFNMWTPSETFVVKSVSTAIWQILFRQCRTWSSAAAVHLPFGQKLKLQEKYKLQNSLYLKGIDTLPYCSCQCDNISFLKMHNLHLTLKTQIL